MSIYDFAKMIILLLFFHLCQNSTCLRKVARKCFLEECQITLRLLDKNFVKITSHCASLGSKEFTQDYTVSEIKLFFCFAQKFKWPPNIVGNQLLAKKSQMTVHIAYGSIISSKSRSVSKINQIFVFYTETLDGHQI